MVSNKSRENIIYTSMTLDEGENKIIYTVESRPFDYIVIASGDHSHAFTLKGYPVEIDDTGQLYITLKKDSKNSEGQRCELRLHLDLHCIDEVKDLPLKVGFYGPDYCGYEDCKEVLS